MKKEYIRARDVVGAREEIFNIIQRNPNSNIIYFDGWNGFGATAVLRSIAQTLPSKKAPPPELCFGRTFLIDCSTWQSKRVMQRKIAEELKLDRKAMAMIDEQDEEDGFNGVDYGSRDVVRQVSAMIVQTLTESRFMMLFLNGSNAEVDLSEFGIPGYLDSVVIWTFRRSFVTMHETDGIFKLADKLRRTDHFIYTEYKPAGLSDSELNALFSKEAANDIVARYPFMPEINLTMVIDCCCYGFFLHRISRSTIVMDWAPHAPNFWICDGIIQEGDRTREISNALGSEISFGGDDDSLLDKVFDRMMQCLGTYHLVVKGEDDDNINKYEERPYRWISVTSKKKIVQDNMKNILARATSIFLAFDRTIGAPSLSNDLFKQCSKVGVLILSCCAFNFESPPFLHCHTLRFLGLDHCTDDNTIEHQGGVCATKWAFLKSLWVFTIYYTDWDEILSEEKIVLMANLMELNVEGVRWPRWTSHHQLQKRLPNLQRLRIIRPVYDEAAETTSSDIGDLFLMDNTSLEILDLSGSNRVMGRNLAASISKASKLQVLILDGCDELEDIVLSNNSSLRSFSLDGYGPASSHRASTVELPPYPKRPPADAGERKSVVKTSIISLQGCGRLDNLFLRGLPNLVELDLSGCPIKVLDFETMMVDVPRLKRLFLLGCECLRAIKWGSDPWKQWKVLELLCIDTRSAGRVLGCAAQPSLGTFSRSFHLQVHAIIVDARLARSLAAAIVNEWPNVSFSINITSLTACSGAVVQPEATASKMTETIDENHHVVAGLYDDIFTKVGNALTPMQAFPQPPTQQSDHHIEIGDGSRNVQTETQEVSDIKNLVELMTGYTESIHVHDVSTCSSTMPASDWHVLKWCRVERCRNLHAVFPPGAEDYNGMLETIWVSDLLMASCVWSKGPSRLDYSGDRFKGLQHLHLRCCPSLRFALAMGSQPSFPSLETIHIIHCGDIRHIFVPGMEEYQHTSVEFPKLTTIHLHDLPALQQICEAAKTLAPALKTIRIRGCPNLRQLPSLMGREPSMRRRPAVEVEKDVWDKLEWDGVDAGHHPSLYEKPVHSRYYKRSRLLRGTVLR
ncbi:unnamed protein product [Urochloa decumbens]|uniref:Disease resistance protein At4g27190-like leucine-rich repeats domain-containing protein n=1 Tax=Urochloa decumbens TaxID=240449 RepID=A0ABC9B7M7_9POAL